MTLPLADLSRARDWIGKDIVSPWLLIDQARVDEFARATGDLYWIHTDPARAAAESPFKTTIAHGFLTLSLLTHFYYECVRVPADDATGLNYGLDKVRFIAPVKVGDRVRARFVLEAVEPRGAGQTMYVFACAVEVEGAAKPALVATWRNVYLTAAPARAQAALAPGITAKGIARRAERESRQAEALRANLARRKTQARTREDGG